MHDDEAADSNQSPIHGRMDSIYLALVLIVTPDFPFGTKNAHWIKHRTRGVCADCRSPRSVDISQPDLHNTMSRQMYLNAGELPVMKLRLLESKRNPHFINQIQTIRTKTTTSTTMTYQFEGWLAHGPEDADGKMKWGPFEPKKWTEDDVDIKVTHCGVCGTDGHTLRQDWGPTQYRKLKLQPRQLQ